MPVIFGNYTAAGEKHLILKLKQLVKQERLGSFMVSCDGVDTKDQYGFQECGRILPAFFKITQLTENPFSLHPIKGMYRIYDKDVMIPNSLFQVTMGGDYVELFLLPKEVKTYLRFRIKALKEKAQRLHEDSLRCGAYRNGAEFQLQEFSKANFELSDDVMNATGIPSWKGCYNG